MRTGEVVGARFEIEAAGIGGGMGLVHRARDRRTGRLVALKTLRLDRGAERFTRDAQRFAREVEVLAELRHPAIVGYVAHGHADDGAPWLAMDWIDGPTLDDHLRAGAVTPEDALACVARIAEGLAVAHERGIVHRDVKPSNVVLAGGELARAVLVDFGVARTDDALTRTGEIVGTAGYLAPEVVLARKDVGPPADVFGLACVLYECVRGERAFRGDGNAVVLLKLLNESPPRLHEVMLALGARTGALLESMFDKDPRARPTAFEVVGVARSASLTHDAAPVITSVERRLESVVLVRFASEEVDVDATLDQKSRTTVVHDATRIVQSFGGRVDLVFGGTLAVTFGESESPVDRASRAALAALALKSQLGSLPVVLCLGTVGGASSMKGLDPVADRAARLLAAETQADVGVAIDDATTRLLDGRFLLEVRDGRPRLVAADRVSAPPTTGLLTRPVLGRAIPCVGREREIRRLVDVIEEARDESHPTAALLLGPAGIGKTRILREALARATDGALVLAARGDALAVGSPHALIGQMLRGRAELRSRDDHPRRRERLAQSLASVLPPSSLERVATFLAELAAPRGIDAGDASDVSTALRAARRDPQLMAAQLERAVLEWLSAEAAQRLVVLYVDDLQWGDAPSLRLLGAAVAGAGQSRLVALATARPEVSETLLPWMGERRLVVHVAPLGEAAATQLVAAALGNASPEAVRRVVELGGGNGFYLEELAREVAEHGTEDLPLTVLAAAQGRVAQLPAPVRRVMRAASVLGMSFDGRAVEAIAGGGDVEGALAHLCDREVLVRSASDPHGHRFRHALSREAAYAMLTDADRRLGHRTAADWLEAEGGAVDAVLLAEHRAQAGENDAAARWLAVAARRALDAKQTPSAIALARRGLTLAPPGPRAAELHALVSQAHRWEGESQLSMAAAREALGASEVGSTTFFLAAGELGVAAARLGLAVDRDRAVAALAAEPLDRRAQAEAAMAATLLASLLYTTDPAAADALVDRAEAAASSDDDPVVRSRLHNVRAIRAEAEGDLARCLSQLELALRCLEATDDQRRIMVAKQNIADTLAALGQLERAEELLRGLIDGSVVGTIALINLANVVVRLRRPDALAVAQSAVDRVVAQGTRVHEPIARLRLAAAHVVALDTKAAALEIERALEVARSLAPASPPEAHALAMRARLARWSGKADEALADAGRAIEIATSAGGAHDALLLARLEAARALEELGRRVEAEAAWQIGCAELDARAGRLADPVLRERFLSAIEEHRAIRERSADPAPAPRAIG